MKILLSDLRGLFILFLILTVSCKKMESNIAKSFDETNSTTSISDCSLNGSVIKSGNSVRTFRNANVPFGEKCSPEDRVCQKGTLSGSFKFASCDIAPASSCVLDNTAIANGSSVSAFQFKSVPFGQTCPAPQNRVCNNGVLSGTLMFSSCSVAAAAGCPWNNSTISSGQAVQAFQTPTVPVGQTCVSQNRVCTNGNLSGTFTFIQCSTLAQTAGGTLLVQFNATQFNPSLSANSFRTFEANSTLLVGKASLNDTKFTKLNFRFLNTGGAVLKITGIEFSGDLEFLNEPNFTNGAADIAAGQFFDFYITPKPKFLGKKSGLIRIRTANANYDLNLELIGL